MIGAVRGVFTLVGAGIAGLLIWLTTQIGTGTTGGYWEVYGIFAAAGLTMALSQLFGGWTKWGWPRISAGVLLIGFLPVLFVGGWVLLAGQPDANWFQRHLVSWSGHAGIDGAVNDLREQLAVIAFGIGLVFGFTFDTTGPSGTAAPRAGAGGGGGGRNAAGRARVGAAARDAAAGRGAHRRGRARTRARGLTRGARQALSRAQPDERRRGSSSP